MAVARYPVARTAPPAPAIISTSRARVGERDGGRGPPLTELLKPDGCRAPPRSSHRAAGCPQSSAPRAREWVREMVDADAASNCELIRIANLEAFYPLVDF